MNPPVFRIATASPQVLSLLGSSPTRLWPFGEAPRTAQGENPKPYAVWQQAYGTPENTLSCPPDIDLFGVQIDVYATSPAECETVAQALRDAFEAAHCHVVSYNGNTVDDETRLYRYTFTVEFWTPR